MNKKNYLFIPLLLSLCACLNQSPEQVESFDEQTITPINRPSIIQTVTPTNDYDNLIDQDFSESRLSLSPSTSSTEIFTLSELDITETEYYYLYASSSLSPDGQWISTLDFVNGYLYLQPVNNPSAIQTLNLLDHSFPSTIYDWAPDGSGFVSSGYGEGGIFPPFTIVNITNGVPHMETPYIDNDGYYHSLAWSISGNELYIPEFIFSENSIRLCRFNRQMELLSTTDISVELFEHVPEINSMTDGIVIIVNNDEHGNPITPIIHSFNDFTSFLYYYSFTDSELTLIDRVYSPQYYSYCGNSTNSNRIAFLSFSPYHQEDHGYFSIYDLSTRTLISQIIISNIRYDGCEYSQDQSMVAFTTSTASGRGLLIVDLDELTYQYIEGDYRLVGWNNSYGGFSVINRSEEDDYFVEVIRVQ